MTRFHLYTDVVRPGLHLWRESNAPTHLRSYLKPITPAVNGWVTFEADMDPGNTSKIRYMLFEWSGEQVVNYESEAFVRELERNADGSFPADVWLFRDSGTWVLSDPTLVAHPTVRIHLITAERYRDGQLYIWHNSGPGQTFPKSGETAAGPYWDVSVSGPSQSFFNFKFMRPAGLTGAELWEGVGAHRTWTGPTGREVWVKSEASEISSTEPQKVQATFYFRQDQSLPQPRLHLWQDGADFQTDLPLEPSPSHPQWLQCRFPIYSKLYYGARFFWRDAAGREEWEHKDVVRYLRIDTNAADFWMMEGESNVQATKPGQNVDVTIRVLQRPPDHRLDGPLFAHVWIDRSHIPLHENLAMDANGSVSFKTFEGVTTSIKFHTQSSWENLDRHALSAAEARAHPVVYATLDRFQLLWSSPPVQLYANPPFQIRRPGVYEADGFLNFVIHAAVAARVRLWGQWMAAGEKGVDLSCTVDRTFWWTRIPVATVTAGSPSGDYDGLEYHYLIDNGRQLQDPAASWVVHSGFDANSRLMRSNKHVWQSTEWHRPAWDSLIIYQLHPARFTPRHGEVAPLRRIAREVGDPAGYLRQIGATALMLMPLHEFPGDASWGYNPAFYYAIESSYGGPQALKELVDACHQNGLAVILDLVLNHSGNDTPLWNLARETYFDGDTKWGALVNFDNPICQHYFVQCVAYLVEEFKIDGIRLDHTRTILYGDRWEQDIIKVRGSGGGRAFLEAIQSAARAGGGHNCLVIGEHLPNEWDVSRNDGPLDCQWVDDFHDRLLDNFQPWGFMGALADAYKITHEQAGDWFNAMNYGESHDEVGNEDHRLAKVAGYGRGLRAAKVHASAILLSRGIPMFFMGAESAEWRQFVQDDIRPLPLDAYLADPELERVRRWWRTMCGLHRNSNFRGPARLEIRFAQDRMLGFTRGWKSDYYVLLNFGSWNGTLLLSVLNLPDGTYREHWNSTWDEFRNGAEHEALRSNGGHDARLDRGSQLLIPDIGVIILERVS